MTKQTINTLDIKEVLKALVGGKVIPREDAQSIFETTRALKSTEHALLSITHLMKGSTIDATDWSEDKLNCAGYRCFQDLSSRHSRWHDTLKNRRGAANRCRGNHA